MGLKLNTASGSITITAEDGSGNADVTIPRAGIGTVTSLGDLSVTATATELNILDGATVTTTELNYVDGVTSAIQTQLDAKGTVSSLSDLSITATASELNTLDGITATVTELNYVDGVTSSIQTQLDAKQAASSALTTSTTFGGDVSGTYNAIVVADDSHNHIISNVDGLQTALDGKLSTTGTAANSQLLDSLDSSQFLRSDANDTTSGTLSVEGGQLVVNASSGYSSLEMGGPSGAYIDLKSPASDDYDGRIQYDGSNLKITTNSSQPVLLQHNNSTKLSTSSVGIDVSGELIADSYNETYAAVTSSSNATTVNCHNGNAFSHTLTQNTTFTFSNPPASGTAFTFSLEIIQDSSASGYTVTWPSAVDWPSATAPTLTATASAKDVFVFYTRDGGTTWYGFTSGQALG